MSDPVADRTVYVALLQGGVLPEAAWVGDQKEVV